VNDYLDGETAGLADTVIEQTQNHLELDCHPLSRCSPILIRHWLNRIWMEQNWPRQSMTYQWWQKICDTILQESDTVLNLPCSIRFEKTGSTAVFSDLRRPVDRPDLD
jgi:hypothetical protein